MVGLIQRRPTTFRRTGEMSRWRRLCMRRYVLGDVQSEDMFINGMWFLVSILYTLSVVGGVVNCTGVIYGVRTSLFLTSQRMPSRYNAYRCIYNYKNIILLWMWSWKFIYKYINAVRSGDQFFYPSSRNFNFVARWDKKVYRRQKDEFGMC